MPVLRPAVPSVLPSSSALVCFGGLLLGGLLGAGCTPDSSGSPSAPDTTSTVAKTTASSSASAEPPPVPPSDADRTVAERLDDASKAARVTQALVRTRSLRPFDFVPTVVRGRLTLRGDVDTREQYRQAGRVAANVAGVTQVNNRVTVQGRPVSETDPSSGSTEEDQTTHHTVRRGDTLIGIARAYNVSVRQLRALNDLSGALQPGQQIRVR